MKASRNSILAALCAFALVGTVIARPTTRPFAQTAQPEMNLATVQLEEAKGARHPIVHLEKAKDDLQDARHKLAAVRTGRASLSMFDAVMVDYYGTMTPLNQVAKLSIPKKRLKVKSSGVVDHWE